MKNDLISVAMCTYNGAPFLREQLESISGQTFKPFEIVIVDDASNDESVEIIRNFSASVQIPIRLIENKKNLGVIPNFEKAIGLCRGKIIFLADQDDIWDLGKIEAHMEVYATHPQCGYVFSDAELTDENLRTKGQSLWSAVHFSGKRYKAYAAGEQLSTMLKGRSFVYGTTMSFRSIYLDFLLPFATRTSVCTHDVWISYLLSSVGAYGVALPLPLVRYRQHSDNQAGAGRNISFSDRIHRIRETKAKKARTWVEVYRNMANRIRNRTDAHVSESLQDFESKIMHLTIRGNFSGKRGIVRSRDLIAEALSGRYKKYSGSWKSFFRDLVFTDKQ